MTKVDQVPQSAIDVLDEHGWWLIRYGDPPQEGDRAWWVFRDHVAAAVDMRAMFAQVASALEGALPGNNAPINSVCGKLSVDGERVLAIFRRPPATASSGASAEGARYLEACAKLASANLVLLAARRVWEQRTREADEADGERQAAWRALTSEAE